MSELIQFSEQPLKKIHLIDKESRGSDGLRSAS